MNRQITISVSFRRGVAFGLLMWLAGVGVLIAAVVEENGSLGQLGLGLCLGALMITTKYLIDRQAELLRLAFERGREVGRREPDGEPDGDDRGANVRAIRSASDQ